MKIIIEGDFFDCQVLRDRIFLWDTWGQLFVYDIRKMLLEEFQHIRNNYILTIDRKTLDRMCVARVNVKGGIYPLDSAFMDDNLYTSTESGLYRRYIQVGKRFSDFNNGKVKKIVDTPIYQMAKGRGYMALAGQKEGLFELYNSRKFKIRKYGHPIKEVGKDVYSVNTSYTHSVWCEEGNIFSTDYKGKAFESHYRYSLKKDETGRVLRTYYKREEFPMLGAGRPLLLSSKKLQEANKRYLVVYNEKPEYSFIVDGTMDAIPISSKPRRSFKGKYGIVIEAKKELVVVKPNNEIIRIKGPITRSRNTSSFLGKENLIVVLNDKVIIGDVSDDWNENEGSY